MRPLSLQATQPARYTCVSNEFIDNYMPNASGEFVKIYLYVLRYFTGGFSSADCHSQNDCGSHSADNDCFCLSFLADKFNMTENDVLRALRYWEKNGLMQLSYQDGDVHNSETLTCITLNFNAQAGEPSADRTEPSANAGEESQTEASQTRVKPNYTKAQIKQFTLDEELSQLLYIAQKYMGKTLTSSETNSILFFYEELKMSSDLIEYLLEYCISKDHRNFRYMEKVAMDWVAKGIRTPKEAALYTSLQGNDAFAVLKAFGITGRTIAPVEQNYITKWRDTYNFESDIIIEACNRTMQAIHKPSFEYADKVLSQWKEKGIANLSDIDGLDKEFEEARKTQGNAANSSSDTSNQRPKRGSNRFNSFQQRGFDYDELEHTIVTTKLV
jgi:DnaD/phage-associated family protein